MTFYLSIWFFLFLCALLEITKIQVVNKITFFIAVFLLFLFAGFRYGIETDYWSYYRIFNLKENTRGIEPGFYLLIDLYKTYISQYFDGFIFLIALLSISVKYIFFKDTGSSFYALLIYYTLFYILFEYNAIRQGIAVSFLLIASNYIKDKQWKKYLFFVLIASVFHISSLLFLPVYFFAVKTIHIKVVSFFILFAFIIRIFLLPVITILLLNVSDIIISKFINQPLLYNRVSDLLHYFITDIEKLINIGFIRRFVVLLLFVYLNGKKRINNIYFNIYLFGYILYIIFMGNVVLSIRFSVPFEIFMAPMFASVIKNNISTWKTINVFGILSLMLLLLFISTLRNGNAIPYQTFLNIF